MFKPVAATERLLMALTAIHLIGGAFALLAYSVSLRPAYAALSLVFGLCAFLTRKCRQNLLQRGDEIEREVIARGLGQFYPALDPRRERH